MNNELRNLSNKELIEQLERMQTELDKTQSQLDQAHLQLDQTQAQLDKTQQDLAMKQRQYEWLKRQVFGQKRERFEPAGQIELPFVEDSAKKKEEAQALQEKRTQVKEHARRKPHPGREALPENLPVIEEHIHPEGDLSAMSEIRTETTDVLEIRPAQLFIRRYIRHIYADKATEKVLTPSLPDRINPKSIAGVSILATMLIEKFVDHLPVYRQIERLKRLGYSLHLNTAYDWMQSPMDFLQILYERHWKHVLSSGYVMMDETGIKSLESNTKGKAHLGRYWVLHDPLGGGTVFRYHRTRSLRAAKEVLMGFKGFLQSDGYEVYTSLGKQESITHLGCWAHVRRKFFEALSNDKARAEKALQLIGYLYEVEELARQKKLDHAARKNLRLDKALPVLNQFGEWLNAECGKTSPKSAIGLAMRYTLNRDATLMVYLQDGALEIDNNTLENKIRPVAIGRKNYLFAGNDKTAQHAAMMYSFFATCKRHEINEYDWLSFVLNNIPSWNMENLDLLLPQNFRRLNSHT